VGRKRTPQGSRCGYARRARLGLSGAWAGKRSSLCPAAGILRALSGVGKPAWSAPTRRRFERGDVSPPTAMPIPRRQAAWNGEKRTSGAPSSFARPQLVLRVRGSDSGTADPIQGRIFRSRDPLFRSRDVYSDSGTANPIPGPLVPVLGPLIRSRDRWSDSGTDKSLSGVDSRNPRRIAAVRDVTPLSSG